MNKSISWLGILFPFAIGIGIALFLIFSLEDDIRVNNIEFLLNSLITCAATFSGFILTSISVLVSFGSSSVMLELKKGTGDKELKILYSITLVLGFMIIISCIFIGASITFNNHLPKLIVSFGLGLFSSYIVSLLKTGFILLKLMNLVPKPGAPTINNEPSTPIIKRKN